MVGGDKWIWGRLTYFGILRVAVMCFFGGHWLHLEFWKLQSCIFGVVIDCIWHFGDLQSNIFGILLTAFGIFRNCSQIFSNLAWLQLKFFRFAVNWRPYFWWLILRFCNMQSIETYTEVLRCSTLKGLLQNHQNKWLQQPLIFLKCSDTETDQP